MKKENPKKTTTKAKKKIKPEIPKWPFPKAKIFKLKPGSGKAQKKGTNSWNPYRMASRSESG